MEMSYTSLFTYVQISSVSDYVESLKLISFCLFLFQVIENCKSASSEKINNIGLRAVIRYLCLKGLPREAHEDTKAITGGGC